MAAETKTTTAYDRIIIGAGLYGLYAARFCGLKGEKVLVLEMDREPFSRATYVNQARVHMGYHYPRSLSTATKSAGYFQRFCEDFPFAIYQEFDQIYATSARFSWTSAEQFVGFCKAAGIRCEEVSPARYCNEGRCDGAFLTQEYTYDAMILRDFYLKELSALSKVTLLCGSTIEEIRKKGEAYCIKYSCKGERREAAAPFVLNATYASTNQILKMAEQGAGEENAGTGAGNTRADGFVPFKIKYELCEIILCNASERLNNTGITVMDGPFFSIMPFGLTGQHSLTAVSFTHHVTSYDETPSFSCQEGTDCSSITLGNCNLCPHRPESAWPYMDHLAQKYLRPELGYTYDRSLYSMKPILKSSEVDDSRPTAIRVNSVEPTFISVLSGKINTVYDLDEYLL